MNITATLHSTAYHQPDHIAITDLTQAISYSGLSAAVKAAAIHLKSYGVGPGVGIAVMGANSIGFVVMIYAVMETGAVVMPVSPQISSDELHAMMQLSEFHGLLSDGTGPAYRISGGIAPTLPGTDFQLQYLSSDIRHPIGAAIPDAALIRYTSGTTGTSKGVLLSHSGIEARTRAANEMLRLGPGDTVVWVLSMAFHFVVSIILYLRYGCTIALCDEFMSGKLPEFLKRSRGTFLYASPMHIRLLAHDNTAGPFPDLKRVISTSTGIQAETSRAFFERFGIPVSQAYGIIEVGLPVMNLEHAQSDPQAIGRALPAYQVEIVDEEGTMVPEGETGHLVMRGPGMFEAYLHPLRLRTAVMRNQWFYTGDLASKDHRGVIRVEGRVKSMINVAGNKVFPEEVEAVLNAHPAVQASRASAFNHRLLGECVLAEVVCNPGTAPPDVEALRKHCREHLSPYKVPQRIEFVQALPMTDSGKLKRW